MSTLTIAPAVAERLFPTCAPWCAWHYAEDTPEDPGCCWAEDVEIPGAVEIMGTWDERRTKTVYERIDGECDDNCPDRHGDGEVVEGDEYAFLVTHVPAPPLSITLFADNAEGAPEGVSFADLDQAEAAAHAILAMVSRIRGDEELAAVHLSAGLAVQAATEAAR